MVPDKENQNRGPRITSVQLTGVELRPDEDPRIKSPDDILSRLSPKKPLPDLGKTEERAPAARELAELKSRYDQEIAQWREYERRIQEWRAQVVAIVENFRKEAASQQSLLKELERCRATLRLQEQEILRLRNERARLKVAG
jgi:hypothetical protein